MNIEPVRFVWALIVVGVTSVLGVAVLAVLMEERKKSKKRDRIQKLLSRQNEIASLGEIWIEGVLQGIPHELYIKILLAHKMRLDGDPIESSWLYEYPCIRILEGDGTGTVFEHDSVNGGIAVVSVMDEVIPGSIETTEIPMTP